MPSARAVRVYFIIYPGFPSHPIASFNRVLEQPIGVPFQTVFEASMPELLSWLF